MAMKRPWVGSVYVLYFVLYAVAVALVADGNASAAAGVVLGATVSHYGLAAYIAWHDTARAAFEERYGTQMSRVLAILDNGAAVGAAGFAASVFFGANDWAAGAAIGLAVAVNMCCLYVHCASDGTR
ncbi:hypothetical protein [Nereida ignava]|uniref:hypothetical protein n=1 Tax=Nereida ignava TaxID=282199 RepID=UPI0030F928A9